LFAFISLSPFILWRLWITQFPEGIPVSDWLYNQNGIRLRPAWFRWLFAERLGKLILGYYGLIPLGLGLILKPKKDEAIYYLWVLGIIAYLIVFSGGNVTHDYYQAIIVPFVVILIARGFFALFQLSDKFFSGKIVIFLSLLIALFMIGFSFYEIKGYYQVNHYQIIKAGEFVNEHIPLNAKVIASYGGDTAFLFQTNRLGWPAVTYDLDRLIAQGAGYYVSINFDDQTNQIASDPRFQVIEKNKDFVLVKLN